MGGTALGVVGRDVGAKTSMPGRTVGVLGALVFVSLLLNVSVTLISAEEDLDLESFDEIGGDTESFLTWSDGGVLGLLTLDVGKGGSAPI